MAKECNTYEQAMSGECKDADVQHNLCHLALDDVSEDKDFRNRVLYLETSDDSPYLMEQPPTTI